MFPLQAPAGSAAKPAAPAVNTQPAIMKPTEEPPAYSQCQPQVGPATGGPQNI